MSLLSALPGLSKHKTEVSPAPPAALPIVSFDNEAARRIIRAAVEEVAYFFPAPDPWGWLTDNRPDVIKELQNSRKDIDAAYTAMDLEKVRTAADRFIRMHKRAWSLYEQRPPVIEIQDALFQAAV